MKAIDAVSGVKYYSGPLQPERIETLRKKYEELVWREDSTELYLSFISPCGRWGECYNRATSQMLCIDNEWIVNLVGGMSGTL
jgi:hypothetical protein